MLHSLTSFRFVAAFMVFLFHMGLMSQYQLGTAGVQFFFVLSGFILAFNYHSKFKELNRLTIRKFYRARFAKIYPIHVLTFLIAAPLVILYFHPNGLYAIKLAFMSVINLLLIQSFIPNEGTYFNFNGVSWTLSVEALFYVSFPFLLWLFTTKYRIAKNIVLSISILFVIWLTLFLLNINLDEENKFYVWLLHIFPITRLFEFSTGMILGLIFIEKSDKPIRNQSLFTVLEVVCFILFVALLLISKYLDVGMVRGVYFVPLWCLLIYTFAFHAGKVSRMLSSKPLVYLGEISFSFYMIHQLVIRYMNFLQLGQPLGFIICFGVTILLSALLYHVYEEPLRKKIRFGFLKKQSDSKLPLATETV